MNNADLKRVAKATSLLALGGAVSAIYRKGKRGTVDLTEEQKLKAEKRREHIERRKKKYEEDVRTVYHQTKRISESYPFLPAYMTIKRAQMRGELGSRIKKLQQHCEANPQDTVAQGVLCYLIAHFEELFLKPQERALHLSARKLELLKKNPEFQGKL